MVSKGLTEGWQAGSSGDLGRGDMDSGSRQEARSRMTVTGRAYFALSSFVTVYPEAASSASKVTLSPTFTCLSIAASLTR